MGGGGQDLIGCNVDLRVFGELLAAKFPKAPREPRPRLLPGA